MNRSEANKKERNTDRRKNKKREEIEDRTEKRKCSAWNLVFHNVLIYNSFLIHIYSCTSYILWVLEQKKATNSHRTLIVGDCHPLLWQPNLWYSYRKYIASFRCVRNISVCLFNKAKIGACLIAEKKNLVLSCA